MYCKQLKQPVSVVVCSVCVSCYFCACVSAKTQFTSL